MSEPRSSAVKAAMVGPTAEASCARRKRDQPSGAIAVESHFVLPTEEASCAEKKKNQPSDAISVESRTAVPTAGTFSAPKKMDQSSRSVSGKSTITVSESSVARRKLDQPSGAISVKAATVVTTPTAESSVAPKKMDQPSGAISVKSHVAAPGTFSAPKKMDQSSRSVSVKSHVAVPEAPYARRKRDQPSGAIAVESHFVLPTEEASCAEKKKNQPSDAISVESRTAVPTAGTFSAPKKMDQSSRSISGKSTITVSEAKCAQKKMNMPPRTIAGEVAIVVETLIQDVVNMVDHGSVSTKAGTAVATAGNKPRKIPRYRLYDGMSLLCIDMIGEGLKKQKSKEVSNAVSNENAIPILTPKAVEHLQTRLIYNGFMEQYYPRVPKSEYIKKVLRGPATISSRQAAILSEALKEELRTPWSKKVLVDKNQPDGKPGKSHVVYLKKRQGKQPEGIKKVVPQENIDKQPGSNPKVHQKPLQKLPHPKIKSQENREKGPAEKLEKNSKQNQDVAQDKLKKKSQVPQTSHQDNLQKTADQKQASGELTNVSNPRKRRHVHFADPLCSYAPKTPKTPEEQHQQHRPTAVAHRRQFDFSKAPKPPPLPLRYRQGLKPPQPTSVSSATALPSHAASARQPENQLSVLQALMRSQEPPPLPPKPVSESLTKQPENLRVHKQSQKQQHGSEKLPAPQPKKKVGEPSKQPPKPSSCQQKESRKLCDNPVQKQSSNHDSNLVLKKPERQSDKRPVPLPEKEHTLARPVKQLLKPPPLPRKPSSCQQKQPSDVAPARQPQLSISEALLRSQEPPPLPPKSVSDSLTKQSQKEQNESEKSQSEKKLPQREFVKQPPKPPPKPSSCQQKEQSKQPEIPVNKQSQKHSSDRVAKNAQLESQKQPASEPEKKRPLPDAPKTAPLPPKPSSNQQREPAKLPQTPSSNRSQKQPKSILKQSSSVPKNIQTLPVVPTKPPPPKPSGHGQGVPPKKKKPNTPRAAPPKEKDILSSILGIMDQSASTVSEPPPPPSYSGSGKATGARFKAPATTPTVTSSTTTSSTVPVKKPEQDSEEPPPRPGRRLVWADAITSTRYYEIGSFAHETFGEESVQPKRGSCFSPPPIKKFRGSMDDWKARRQVDDYHRERNFEDAMREAAELLNPPEVIFLD